MKTRTRILPAIRLVARYGRFDLLCLDELGYVKLDTRGTRLWPASLNSNAGTTCWIAQDLSLVASSRSDRAPPTARYRQPSRTPGRTAST
jgi:hypothetical protein